MSTENKARLSPENTATVLREVGNVMQGSMGEWDNLERLMNAVRAEERARAVEVVKPFADFGANVDAEGWTSNIHKERISYWFGPSDFRRAAAYIHDNREWEA